MVIKLNITTLNEFKLKFADSQLEQAYQSDYSENLKAQSLFSISLAYALYVLFAYLDLHIVPDHLNYIWTIRVVVILLFSIMIVTINSKYFRLHHQQILTFTALVCMGGLLIMFIPISEVAEGRYYVSLTLVIPWLYISLGLNTKNALYLNVFLLITYNLETLFFKDYPLYIFVNNNYFLVCLSILSFTGGYLIERNRRNSFQKTINLIEEKNKAETANLAKTRFLSAASHDLRQPLHAISLFLDVLEEQSTTPGQSTIISKIKKSSSSLEDLLKSLLDISKLDANVITVTNKSMAIQRTFDALENEFTAIANNKGLEIKFIKSSLWIDSDKQLVGQILRNLISNAISYTEFGKIMIGCRRKENTVSLIVIDTGIGIEENESKIIFEEFHQLHNPGRDRSKGLGLGLSIVKRLTDLLELKLSLVSTPNKGSCFSIEVPRIIPENIISDNNLSLSMNENLHGKLIIIFKDEGDTRNQLQTLLEEWCCTVLGLTCIQDIERKTNSSHCPDIILADYQLGNHETGHDVINALHTYYNNKQIPSAIIIGKATSYNIKEAQDSGVKLLHEPVSGGKLRALINSLLKDDH